jgi:Tfp pilus assembly protein PilX
MLVLITFMVLAAFKLSTNNLKTVGNIQAREEAIASANVAIERTITTVNIPNATAVEQVPVDIDRNGTDDYFVKVTVVGCKQALPAQSDPNALSGVTSGIPNTSGYDTVWELRADLTDSAYTANADPKTGAAITVVQGVRKRLDSLDPNLTKCQ